MKIVGVGLQKQLFYLDYLKWLGIYCYEQAQAYY